MNIGLIDLLEDQLITEGRLRTEILGTSHSTMHRIREDIKQGGDPDQLPPAILVRKRRHYLLSDVRAWLKRKGEVLSPGHL